MARLGVEMLAISEMTEFLVSPSNTKKQEATIQSEVAKIFSLQKFLFVTRESTARMVTGSLTLIFTQILSDFHFTFVALTKFREIIFD